MINSYAVQILMNQRFRLMLTVFGIGLCVILMLFLLAIYGGVKEGSIKYIQRNEADLWVLQQNSWNILRGTSILSTGQGRVLSQIPGVASASPVLLLLPGIQRQDRIATVFLAGYDPSSGLGGPPSLIGGRSVMNDDEIVLDKAFAARMQVSLGDTVMIKAEPLRIVGISQGTNAFVIQYAFVTLSRAQYVAGLSTVVSCYLVKVKQGYSADSVREAIQDGLPGVEVYDHQTFLLNNIREMESGILPLLFVIAAIGAIVLTAILSLLLSVSILERRKDFAVMKTLGSPKYFLGRVVLEQALLISGLGCSLGLAVFFPMCRLIEMIAPEMDPRSSAVNVFVILVSVGIISLVSSLISIQKLRRIYPLEVFV